MLVVSHVEEEFATRFDVLRFDDESLCWLDDSATFRVDDWFAVWVLAASLHLCEELSHFWVLA